MQYNIIAYIIFALVTSISPGPNNYLLFSHGKNHGYKGSSQLMIGIFAGFMVLLYISGYGISEIIMRNNTLAFALKIISSIWLLYLAFMLRNLNGSKLVQSPQKIGFNHGFLMQFVNPKAWIMAITAASAFMPNLSNQHLSVFAFAITFALVGIPSMLSWVSFGHVISKWINTEKTNRIIGYTLFGLMITSVGIIWLS